MDKKKKTQYSFQFLTKKSVALRYDIMPIFLSFSLYFYIFSTRVFDMEDILAVFIMICLVAFHMIIFFLPFWSTAARAFIQYSKCRDLNTSTHVFVSSVNKTHHATSSGIVQLYREDLGEGEDRFSVDYKKKLFEYDQDKKVFKSVKYPAKESIHFYKNALKEGGL